MAAPKNVDCFFGPYDYDNPSGKKPMPFQKAESGAAAMDTRSSARASVGLTTEQRVSALFAKLRLDAKS